MIFAFKFNDEVYVVGAMVVNEKTQEHGRNQPEACTIASFKDWGEWKCYILVVMPPTPSPIVLLIKTKKQRWVDRNSGGKGRKRNTLHSNMGGDYW